MNTRKIKYEKAKLIGELKLHGVVSLACRRTKTPRSTYYHWFSTDANFKADVLAARMVANG